MTLPGLQHVSNSFSSVIEVRSGKRFISVGKTKGTFSVLSLYVHAAFVCVCLHVHAGSSEDRFMDVIPAVLDSHALGDDEFCMGSSPVCTLLVYCTPCTPYSTLRGAKADAEQRRLHK